MTCDDVIFMVRLKKKKKIAIVVWEISKISQYD